MYVVHPHKSNRIVAGEAAELTNHLSIIRICAMSTISQSGVTTIMGTIMGTVVGTVMGTVMGTTIGTIASEVAILVMHLQSETVNCHSFISHRHNSHMSTVITGHPYALGLACNIDMWIQNISLSQLALMFEMSYVTLDVMQRPGNVNALHVTMCGAQCPEHVHALYLQSSQRLQNMHVDVHEAHQLLL